MDRGVGYRATGVPALDVRVRSGASANVMTGLRSTAWRDFRHEWIFGRQVAGLWALSLLSGQGETGLGLAGRKAAGGLYRVQPGAFRLRRRAGSGALPRWAAAGPPELSLA